MSTNFLKRIYCRTLYSITGGIKAEDIYRRKDDDVIGKEVVLIIEDSITGEIDKSASLFGGKILKKNKNYEHSFYYIEWYYENKEIIDTICNIYGKDKFIIESHEITGNVSCHNINDLRVVSLSQTCIKTISENGLLYYFIVIGFIAWLSYCIAVGAWKDIYKFFK